jgi:hypothetical protein
MASMILVYIHPQLLGQNRIYAIRAILKRITRKPSASMFNLLLNPGQAHLLQQALNYLQVNSP